MAELATTLHTDVCVGPAPRISVVYGAEIITFSGQNLGIKTLPSGAWQRWNPSTGDVTAYDGPAFSYDNSYVQTIWDGAVIIESKLYARVTEHNYYNGVQVPTLQVIDLASSTVATAYSLSIGEGYSLVAIDGKIYSGSGERFDTTTNTLTPSWLAAPSPSLAVAGGRLFRLTASAITEVNLSTGANSTSWTWPVAAAPQVRPAVVGGKILVSSTSSSVAVVGFDTATDSTFAVAAIGGGFTSPNVWTVGPGGTLWHLEPSGTMKVVDPATGRFDNVSMPPGTPPTSPGTAAVTLGGRMWIPSPSPLT